jgi:CRISPR-associated helicase Cas3
MTARRELLTLSAKVSGVETWLVDMAGCDLHRPRELALSGLIVLADWIASNEALFPYASAAFVDGYVERARHHAGNALSTIGWKRWCPGEADRKVDWFDRRFGFAPNAVQRTAITAASASPAPGLMFIEAPMGVGKTEAALGVVETLASVKGLSGMFVGLPTQATSNQMFARTTRWLENLGPGTFVVELAHGKAHQVEEYRERHETPSCVDCDGDNQAVVTAEEWFGGSKRRLLAPFVVGTVDQVLLSSAKVRHVALRQVGLTDKVVVIDEVHAYDAHMSVFLRRALRWLGASGVPVVLLTATLPPRARQRLAEAYVGGAVELGAIGYPSVTTASTDGVVESQTVALPTAPTKIALSILDEQPGDPSGAQFNATVSSLVEMGANVLVIRNTVDRAQRSYRSLASVLGPGPVTLLHARFLSGHRLSKERWLAQHFGPNGSRLSGQVVVGTQVLEQSLDIDFDALVTDLAPVDLILQRVGRVWRHQGVERPSMLTAPRLILAGMQRNGDSPPEFPSGSRLVYGEHLLLRTAALLEGRSEVELPGSVPALVAQAYGDSNVVPASWTERADVAAIEWAAREREHEATADQFAIPAPDHLPNLLELCRFGIDGDDDDPAVQSAVRDSDASVEVVLGRSGQANGPLCGNVEVPLQTRPEPAQVQAALSCTLRLPSWITPEALALHIPEGWQHHPWLRRLRVVELTEDGEARIGKHVVRYSEDLGLEVTSDAG